MRSDIFGFIGVVVALILGTSDLGATGLNQRNLQPEEVLVIANQASKDSLEVANYYMNRRGIPKGNLFTVSFPNHRHSRYISHSDFQEKLVKPLQHFLEKNQLKEKILALVLVYDMPYKVAGPVGMLPSIQKKIEKKEAALSKILQESGEAFHKIQRLRKQIATLKSDYDRLVPVWQDLLRLLPAAQHQSAAQVLENSASVDSELAWLFRSDVYGASIGEAGRLRAYFGRSKNFYFGQRLKFRDFRNRLKKRGRLDQIGVFYVTARLEGPSIEISKNLVDSAMKAEAAGPSGIGCFDARKSTLGRDKTGYDLGEVLVRRAYIETINAGFDAKFDEQKELFKPGDCPQTFLYWGWYALTDYRDIFNGSLASGALAVHTASGEAKDIRHFKESGRNPWCAGLLTHGAAFCSGPIAEPFLDAFPHADLFYPRLFNGWSAGEAYWAAQAYTSWMMVMIGDPLYAPFAGKNQIKTHVSGRIHVTSGKSPESDHILRSHKKYRVTLLIKAIGPIFQTVDRYKISEYRTNRSKQLVLTGSERAVFKVEDGGTLLIVKGLQLETHTLGGLRYGELEVTIDLGEDGGRKIVSQLFEISGS